MATVNLTTNNDIIIPTNDDTTYRGLGGNDTYILVSQENSASVSIIDTGGNNVIQLPEWSKIKSISATNDALRITCDNMTVFTINGADKFSYDIGGNVTNNSLGKIKTFNQFVEIFELTPPSSGNVSTDTNKIVYDDEFRTLYEVKVQKEDNGNKYYINNELSPDLSFSSIRVSLTVRMTMFTGFPLIVSFIVCLAVFYGLLSNAFIGVSPVY